MASVLVCGERACPALRCEAAPKPANAVLTGKMRRLGQGRFATQRGASPLATDKPLAKDKSIGHERAHSPRRRATANTHS